MHTQLADSRPEVSELQTESPTPARVWGDQWLRISEKVLKGLNHQLTNRVASLEAVASILEDASEPPPPEMVRALATEVGRLSHLLTLYRLMPAEPFVTTEAVRVQDVLPQVLELHSHHADLRGISVNIDGSPDTPPVLVRPSALLRCLLVVLESAAGNALRSGSQEPLNLSYAQDGHHVVVTFEGVAPAGQLLFSGEGSTVHAVRTALAHARATLEADPLQLGSEHRVRFVLRLPTLAESRRLDRQNLL